MPAEASRWLTVERAIDPIAPQDTCGCA